MVLLAGGAPPWPGQGAHTGVQGRMERVLGGLSKADPVEMLQELGGASDSHFPGLSWMSKCLEVGEPVAVVWRLPKYLASCAPSLETPKTSSPG